VNRLSVGEIELRHRDFLIARRAVGIATERCFKNRPIRHAHGGEQNDPAVPAKGVLFNLHGVSIACLTDHGFFHWPERGLFGRQEAKNGGKNMYLDYVGLLLCSRIALMMMRAKNA
jgi:hypothetical protein